MKRLLQLGFILGFVGTLAGAYFAPMFEYTRHRSATSVVANGGRVEQFVVRLPADRIDSTAGPAPVSASPDTRLQHFKLRDATGNVIGLAARHSLAAGETAWMLTIPSRGTIALAGNAVVTEPIESVAAERGLAIGETLEQALSIDVAAPARSVTATGEFANLEFDLVETWVVTGIDEDGQVHGTLQLNTIGRQPT
jgi:hypothetical protein